MQHGGDHSSLYAPPFPSPPPPNPKPASGESTALSDPIQHSDASAPPYDTEFSPFSAPYSDNPVPAPGLSLSELPHPAAPAAQAPALLPPYNPLPYPPEPSLFPHQYYAPPVNPSPPPHACSDFPPSFPSYSAPYDGPAARSGQDVGYFNENSGSFSAGVTGGYGHGPSGFDQGLSCGFSDSNSYGGMRYDQFGLQNDGFGGGVNQYNGGRSEPYGSQGTAPGSSPTLFDDYGRSEPYGSRDSAPTRSPTLFDDYGRSEPNGFWDSASTRSPTLFDDYGRSISLPSGGKDQGGGSTKLVKAVPKADTEQDVKNGAQKFRVKLLPEGGGQSTMDVLCQIGLDGIRILDSSNNRTLRIYPLDTVTRWEVSDSSTFTFWSKTSVDLEPRRIRLQSNSYTNNTILDTVTAATVQLKEIGGADSIAGGRGTADASKVADQSAERKKGLADWMNLIKPANEEKDHWVPDEAVRKCTSCGSDFGAFNRRHHCRNCGDIFCDKCTKGRIALTADENAQPVRVCDRCMAEVTRRLNNAKEATSSKPAALQSHEDLARKLQVEIDRNHKSGSQSTDGSGNTREVACPICTVQLQVQVPNSGTETIECGVCQHPFLVSAH